MKRASLFKLKKEIFCKNSQKVLSNVRSNEKLIQAAKKQLEKNSLFLNHFIGNKVNSLSGIGSQKYHYNLEIPEERYTAF